jgi:hypothetical protein
MAKKQAKKPTKKTFPRGNELLRQVVNQIIKHPETWDQSNWHCGSSHCVGGWAQVMGGREPDAARVFEDARKLLGLSEGQASWLFYGGRTFEEIYCFAAQRLEKSCALPLL